MTSKIVSVCHIQHDFKQCIQEGNEGSHFYINIDKSPNEIEECTVTVSDHGSKFDAGENNSFVKLGENMYEATIAENKYRFCTMDNDNLDTSTPESDIQWTCIDATSVPETRYALGDARGNIKIYDALLEVQNEWKNAHMGELTSLRFFPSGEVLLSSSTDLQIKIWSVLDGSNPRTFIGHKAAVTDTCMIEKGRNFLSSSLDGSVRLWECASGSNLHSFTRKENPTDGVNTLGLLSDSSAESGGGSNYEEFGTLGKKVLAGHSSGVITLHEVFSKKQELQIPSTTMSSCNSLATDYKNTNYIYAGYQNGALAKWDLRQPDRPVDCVYINANSPINHIYNYSDGIYISSGVDTNLKLDLESPMRNIRSDLPTFLVSDDNQVAQFTSAPNNQGVIAVGNWGFQARYRC